MKQTKVTIKDIAKCLGVSTTLVSFALSESPKKHRVSDEMIEKIRKTAKEMDYQPNNAARSLRSGRSNTIGVILSDISNRFFADIARCIEDKASQNGYTVLFGSTDEKPVADLVESGFPVVLIDRTFDNIDVSSVTLNNIKATFIAVSELVRQAISTGEKRTYANLLLTIGCA